MKNSLILGIFCAKDHAGNHQLYRAGNYAECAGCSEYYTFSEVATAVPHAHMLARGLKRAPLQIPKARNE